MRRAGLAMAFGAFWLTACDDSNIGGVCKVSEDCGDQLFCKYRSICTKLCDESHPCPDGSVCSKVGGSDGYCWKSCDSDDDCHSEHHCSSSICIAD